MSDPILIAYSWIGPKGPIINTELPNILSFSAVAEGAHATSRNFWADDIWWRIFHGNGDYVLSSTFALDDKHTFIYPFTLTWRVPFGNYFYGNSGLFEFAHTPNHIIHHVRMSKGYFLIDCTAEAWVEDSHLQLMHNYFSHFNHIPMGKIIYLTGCMNAKEVYNRFCQKNNIPPNSRDRMKLFSFPISQHGIATNLSSSNEPTYDVDLVPEKLFLCWNRRFRSHRTTLALGLDKNGLVDRSYYSMGLVDPEATTTHFESTVDLHNNHKEGISSVDITNFINKLPLIIDGETSIYQMCQDFDSAARNFYTNSLVSIVTETNFATKTLTLTEKSFKPSKEKHPFIIVGVPGALKAMREFGFQTFGEFWDESYDEEENSMMRLHKIIEVCKDIGNWDKEKILDFKRKVKPILENNYIMVQRNTAKVVAEKIENVIRQGRILL
jgi:hypothetical protein